MRIAFFTDVHGNLPALSSALGAIAAKDVDAVYHLGDAIGVGPYPAECLALLLATPRMHLVMGNHDAWFARGLPAPQPSWMSDGERAHHRWVHSQLDPALRPIVGCWPYVVDLVVGVTPVTFCHYGLVPTRDGFADIVRHPIADDLDGLFASAAGAVVGFGHDHAPAVCRGQRLYVNPGSVGCSPDAIARFAILDAVEPSGGLRLEQHAIPYDDADLFRAFDRRGVPERDFLRDVMLGGRRRWPWWNGTDTGSGG